MAKTESFRWAIISYHHYHPVFKYSSHLHVILRIETLVYSGFCYCLRFISPCRLSWKACSVRLQACQVTLIAFLAPPWAGPTFLVCLILCQPKVIPLKLAFGPLDIILPPVRMPYAFVKWLIAPIANCLLPSSTHELCKHKLKLYVHCLTGTLWRSWRLLRYSLWLYFLGVLVASLCAEGHLSLTSTGPVASFFNIAGFGVISSA